MGMVETTGLWFHKPNMAWHLVLTKPTNGRPNAKTKARTNTSKGCLGAPGKAPIIIAQVLARALSGKGGGGGGGYKG